MGCARLHAEGRGPAVLVDKLPPGGRRGHEVVQALPAALQRQVHKLGVLLHREAAHDVGVLVAQDQRADLLVRQLVELRARAAVLFNRLTV